MNNQQRQPGPGGDIRSFLKSQHRKVYSICRLFTTNYKEQQALFANMLSAVSHSMMGARDRRDKNSLLLNACINMAALHSIDLELAANTHHPRTNSANNHHFRTDREIQFKSPEFQHSMQKFSEAVGDIQDYEKICLFGQLENISPDEIGDLVGIAHADTRREWSWSGRNFIPYLKQKLVWN